MEHVALVRTDTATLALFDPQVLASRASDSCDWWTDAFHLLPEVAQGQAAIVSLSGDGIYKVRVSDGPLTDDELTYASERLTLGLTVSSGEAFVGAAEWLPSEESAPDRTVDWQAPYFFAIPTGTYAAVVYGIEWQDAPDWYAPEGAPIPASAPPDVVIQLSPISAASRPIPLLSEPRLFAGGETWLYPNRPRRLGPVPGMTLETTVVRRRDDLVLKPCGPRSYRPLLADMSGLRWNDRITVEVVAVNHETSEFKALLKP